MSSTCDPPKYPYNKPTRSTPFDEYENEHNMSPEEKIQYVKDRKDEEIKGNKGDRNALLIT